MPLPPSVTNNPVPLTSKEPLSTDGAYRWRHWDITKVCVDLAGSTNGLADPISHQRMQEELQWLQWRIRHWQPSTIAKTAPIDGAVRDLVLATINLLEMELSFLGVG